MNMIDLTADSETSESEEDSYECKTCGKSYSELTELLSHTLAHSAQSTEDKTDNVPNAETTRKPPNEKGLNTETISKLPGSKGTVEYRVAINQCDEVVDLTDDPVPSSQIQTEPAAIGNSILIGRGITEPTKPCLPRKGLRTILPKQTNAQTFSMPIAATSIVHTAERPKEGLTLVLDLTQNAPISLYGVRNLVETRSVHTLSSADPKAGHTQVNGPNLTKQKFRVITGSRKSAGAVTPVRQAPCETSRKASDILSDKNNQTSSYSNQMAGGSTEAMAQASFDGNGRTNTSTLTTKDPYYTTWPDPVSADIEDGSDMNVDDDDDLDSGALIIDDTVACNNTESDNTNTKQPSKSHDTSMEQPSESHDTNVEQPSKSHDTNVAQPSKSYDTNMEQPSESHDTNMEQPSESHDTNMAQPSESHEANIGQPSKDLPHKCKDCSKSFASLRQWLYHSQMHFSYMGLKCSVCSKVCKSVGGFMNHLATHNRSDSLCCNFCGKEFVSRLSLKRHMSVHSSERRYKCITCGAAFKVRAMLNRHMSIHTGERPYACSECGQSFRLKELLNSHMKTHRSFSCVICWMSFKTESNLTMHVQSHVVERSYHSQTTSDSDVTPLMSDSNSLSGDPGNGRHGPSDENVAPIASSDPFSGALIIDDSDGDNTTESDDTNLQQPSKSHDTIMQQPSKRNHMSVHFTDRPHKCKICGVGFKRKPNLKRHMTIHTGERPYTCSQCGLGFRLRELLNQHMKVHKSFSCVVCGLRFKTESILTMHVQSHVVERSYHSQTTSDSDVTPLMSDSNSLSGDPGNGRHGMLDENFAPLASSDPMISRSSSSESTNIKVKLEQDRNPEEATLKSKLPHKIKVESAIATKGLASERGVKDRSELSGSETLENTHSCHICGMIFAAQEAHKQHLDLHRKYKSLDCVVCGRRDFENHSKLKKHMVAHSDVRSHKCKLCGKAFKRIDTLNLHLKVHSDDRPYKCVICRKGFKSSSSRAFHLQTHLVEGQKNAGKLLKPKIEKFQNLNNYASKVGTQGEKVEQKTSASLNTERIKLEGRHRKIKEERRESMIQKNKAAHKSNETAKDAPDWVNIPRQNNLPSQMEVNAVVGTDLTVAAAASANVHSHAGDLRVSSQSRTLPYKCTKCDKSFLKFHQLSFHSRIHKDDSPIKCHVCGMVFAAQDSLKEHLLMHKKGQTLQCVICGKKGFKTKFKLESHMVVHSDVRPYECKTCGKGFKRTADLRLHERYHNDENPYECVICRKGFKSASARSSHLKIHLVKRNELARTLSKPQGDFPQYANSPAATSPYVPSNMSSAAEDLHGNEKQLDVDSSVRGKSDTKMVTDETTSMNTRHQKDGENRPSYSRTLPYKCRSCEMSFQHFYKLAAHARTHGFEDLVKCYVCGIVVEGTLQNHLEFHCNAVPICSVCGKSFTTRSSLKQHMAVHSDDRPYKCKICGKDFKRKIDLKVHVAIHNDDRPYLCVICQRGFKSYSQRATHLHSHTVKQNSH